MTRPVNELVQAFTAGTLPRHEWTHHAHLTVGLWHVLQAPSPGEALEALRRGIRRYNVATGTENTDCQGYHETITRFYVGLIQHFLQHADRRQPIDALAAELIARHGERSLLGRHYSRKLLDSSAARLHWHEPDRRPLPAAQPRGTSTESSNSASGTNT
ncbi:MAG: hypothetical protein ACKO5F_06550 [Synechococcus sp.]